MNAVFEGGGDLDAPRELHGARQFLRRAAEGLAPDRVRRAAAFGGHRERNEDRAVCWRVDVGRASVTRDVLPQLISIRSVACRCATGASCETEFAAHRGICRNASRRDKLVRRSCATSALANDRSM